MKKVLSLGASAFVLTMLTGCGSPDTPVLETPEGQVTGADTTLVTDEQVEISVAWWGSQERHDRTVEVINMFMDQYPHINVTYQFFDSAGYWTVMNTNVAANDVWDVFQMGGNFPQFMDIILPLNDLIDRGYIDISNAEQSIIEATSADDLIVGISNGVNTHAVAWDPAMFDAAGAPHPHEDWTWADFEEAAMLITENLGVWGSSQFANDFTNLTLWATQSGYNFFDPETFSTSLGIPDSSILVGYYEMRSRLVIAGAMPDPGDEMVITDIEGDPIVTGDAAMTWVASNQFVALATAAGRPLQLAPLPRVIPGGESGMGVNSSQMFSVWNGTSHQEAAAQFVSFFQNSVEANQILLGERGVPIMSHVRDALTVDLDPIVAQTYYIIDIAGRLDTGFGNPIESPHNPEIESHHNLLMEQVIFGIITPEQAAQQLFDFATSILS